MHARGTKVAAAMHSLVRACLFKLPPGKWKSSIGDDRVQSINDWLNGLLAWFLSQ